MLENFQLDTTNFFGWVSLSGVVSALLAFLVFFWLIRHLLRPKPSGSALNRFKEDTVPLIVGLCAAILTFYFVERRLLGSDIHNQVFSIIVQFLFLIIFGGAVTTIYQARLQSRVSEEKRKAERAAITERDRLLLLAMHDNLISAYNRAKRVRRLLLARLEYPEGNAGPRFVPKSEYNKQMEQLIDAELDFESILRRIAGNVPLFGKDSRLDGCLDGLEKYLTDTVKEFRKQLRNFDGDPPRKNLGELPKLEAFLGLDPRDDSVEKTPDDDSRQRFKDQFRTAIQYLHKEINKRARRINRTGSILWVDGRPQNNRYEIDQLEEDGYEVTIAQTTSEAEAHLTKGLKPMLIISNMGRVEDGQFNARAGLDLFKKVGEGIPVYFYTPYAAVAENRQEVEEIGARGITDSRLQLFSVIDECADAVERIDQTVISAETTV